ncbi:MAG: lysophospholipase [Cyanobacteria bacterium]|nr:lysophospholipase [Cyanobacteriota bacterium]
MMLATALAVVPINADASVVYNSQIQQSVLPICKWQDPSKSPRAVALLLHGISQRAYTLRTVASQLASKGIIVYGLDLRGHGWWHHEKTKGDGGYKSDYPEAVTDTREVMQVIAQNHPHMPLFLVGESVGSAVALRAATMSPPENLKGLVLCGAGSKCSRTKLTWFMSDFSKACLGRPVNIVRYQRKYGTDDLEALEETIKDPLQRKTFALSELWRARCVLRGNKKFAKRLDPQLSVLMIHGKDDGTLTLKSAEKVYAKVPSFDKKLVVVPGCGHILLGTGNPKKQVTEPIAHFIRERAGSALASVETDKNL